MSNFSKFHKFIQIYTKFVFFLILILDQTQLQQRRYDYLVNLLNHKKIFYMKKKMEETKSTPVPLSQTTTFLLSILCFCCSCSFCYRYILPNASSSTAFHFINQKYVHMQGNNEFWVVRSLYNLNNLKLGNYHASTKTKKELY